MISIANTVFFVLFFKTVQHCDILKKHTSINQDELVGSMLFRASVSMFKVKNVKMKSCHFTKLSFERRITRLI